MNITRLKYVLAALLISLLLFSTVPSGATIKLVTSTSRYQGLSTDTKPTTVTIGSLFWEEDTGVGYRFDGASWGIVGSTISGPDGSKMTVSSDGAAETHLHAHHYSDISVHLTDDTGITDTSQSISLKDTRDMVVSNGAQWAVGKKVKIPGEYDILTIKAISTNTLSFDRYLDIDHASGTVVTGVTQNLKSAGSAATPVIYGYTATESEHIHGLHVVIASTDEPALFRFGGIDALEYGIHFRVVGGDRTDTYWIPLRTSNSMILSGFTYTKEEKVSTTWFAHLRINLQAINNNIIILSPGETLQCLVQDPLSSDSSLVSLEIKLDKHREL